MNEYLRITRKKQTSIRRQIRIYISGAEPTPKYQGSDDELHTIHAESLSRFVKGKYASIICNNTC